MGVNDYFDPRRKNRPHETPNYGPEKSKFEFYSYRQKYFSPEKLAHIRKKTGKIRSITNAFF